MAVYKIKNSWRVHIRLNGVNKHRAFKSKQLADKVSALVEGWKEVLNAQGFIRDCLKQGLLNTEQRSALETYIDKKLCDITEGQKIQILNMYKDCRKVKQIIFCTGCNAKQVMHAKNMCKKCYNKEHRKINENPTHGQDKSDDETMEGTA